MSNSSTPADFNFQQAMARLEEINQWFQQEDALDLEKGLVLLREGKDLILACRQRLQNVENEFVAVKEEFSASEASSEE